MTPQDLRTRTLSLIAGDPERTACLRLVAELNLPQSAIAAGFVRNAIWDACCGVRTDLVDIDVVYFAPHDTCVTTEGACEQLLREKLDFSWQVRNQARMHLRNEVPPYASAVDAVSRFPETATCLSVCLNSRGSLWMPNSEGLMDAWSGVPRPNPLVANARSLVAQRMATKNWLAKWPGLRVQA